MLAYIIYVYDVNGEFLGRRAKFWSKVLRTCRVLASFNSAAGVWCKRLAATTAGSSAGSDMAKAAARSSMANSSLSRHVRAVARGCSWLQVASEASEASAKHES